MDDHPERHPSAAYTVELPRHPRPIVIIGTGGIVKDAHLPAYRKAGYPVWGLVNRTIARAQALADEYGIEHVFGTVAEAVAAAPSDAVYDIALMPEQYADALEALPDGAAVLIQKPLGHTLEQGVALRDLCRRKGLIAAVNTQLRFAPYVAEARRLIAAGTIGELYDLEIRVQVDTPWHLFPHVFGLERLEINMHSVHYLDLVRSFLGDPDGVSAVTLPHPEKHEVANTRSTILLRYRDRPLRVTVSTNHDHAFGPEHEESYIKWEGTRGAIRAQMGLLLDYPTGGPDALELILLDEKEKGWQDVPFEGSWFPDAFIGSMGAVQRFVEGSVPDLPTSVDDVLHTMAVVEAAYTSQEREGVEASVPVDEATGR
ncbi:Gfo/Idh/MocA family oxidoreductase [Microbacterium sp. CFBP9034]|uniref:Gfo/Idh/MocA family protein n=1 Tax=Microbacterium sp. CFBP9034 TaxID=3096540 RepID=UPI002A6B6EDE|nr:Gfo/Idh/MocA family oxidoreductase [Microbacterium sp. CFBP9034]MDY0908226.1 Gfo/Idh/MocA family oxidoreductase [Microbacterium sp. CFBP9034]